MYEPDDDAIIVFRFYEAPSWAAQLSPHGGDEEWVALVPARFDDDHIPWLEESCFGPACVSKHKVKAGPYKGWTVVIGAHS